MGALPLLLLAACEGGRLVPVRPDGLDFPRAFPLVLGPGGEVRRLLPPLALAAGEVGPASPARLELELAEERLLLLGLRAAELEPVEPSLDPAVLADSELLLSPPPAAPELIRAGDLVRRVRAVPAELPLFALEEEEGGAHFVPWPERAPLAGLSLSVPVDLERCGPAPGALVPFARAPRLLPGSQGEGVLLVVRAVDAERVVGLARSPATLYLFHVNDEASRPSAALDLSSQSGGFLTATGLHVDTTSAGGPARVWVAARAFDCPEDQCEHGLLLELAARGTGLELVRTATRTRRPLHDVLRDGAGRLLAVGADAGLYLSDGPGGVWRAGPPPPVRPDRPHLWRLAPGPDAQVPHLLGGEQLVLRGDAARGDWRVSSLEPVAGERLRVTSVAAAADGEVWATSDPPGLWRGPEERLRAPDLALAPRLAGCAGADLAALSEPRAVVVRGGYAWVAAGCSALLRVRREDGCTTALSLGSGRPAPGGALWSLSLGPGGLLAGGEQGALYRLAEP